MTKRKVLGWSAAAVSLGFGVMMMLSGPKNSPSQSFGGGSGNGSSSVSPTALTATDSIIGKVCFSYDDDKKIQYDSLSIFFPANGHWRFPFGVTLDPWLVLHGDTVGTSL